MTKKITIAEGSGNGFGDIGFPNPKKEVV